EVVSKAIPNMMVYDKSIQISDDHVSDKTSLMLIDILGNTIAQTDGIVMNTESYASGHYVLLITSAGKTISKPICIIHN
ncbi:MAG: hypothetical protein ACO30M_10170, partial [Candidatus Kapaibacteriota bacterium]